MGLLPSEGLLPTAQAGQEEPLTVAGVDPYRLAWRRLRRNRVALVFGAVFVVIVTCCFMAPLYAHYIAHVGPNDNNVTGTIRLGGRQVDIVSPIGIPIGPTWHSRYFFGADFNGRDVAVRLLYGGRNSLIVGFTATAITIISALVIALLAGYYRGWVDVVLTRFLDLLWAYPAVLLGVAIGTSLVLGGIDIGPLHIQGNSLYVPAVIIGFVNIPYVAKPVRGEVLSLREREFVDAARTLGLGPLKIIFSELLPNLSSTIIVFVPLMIANSILLEAGLSYLGAGVQPPNPSWGTMISDGVQYITSSPNLVLVPGITLIVAVLGVNVLGDGLRDALDPRVTLAKAR